MNESHEDAGREVVGDKGYHGNDILVELVEQEYRYISDQSEVAANGRTNRPSKPPPTRTDVAFAGLEVSD